MSRVKSLNVRGGAAGSSPRSPLGLDMTLGNIHLTPQLVQAVRDAADVVAVASEHTRLRQAGRRWAGLCPLHKEKTPSFSVDVDRGLFYCFGCGRGGDAIKLHMLLTGDDFPQAIDALARRFGVPLPAVRRRSVGPDIEGALTAAVEFYADRLRRSTEARAYLEKRRVSPELAQRFGLGYAPAGWRNLVGALHPRVPMAALEAAGLVARPERGGDPYDRFRHRLIFPIRSPSGRLVGFGGRALDDDQVKYINTAETASFHKGDLLYGLDLARRAIREAGRALLVEGYFDVIAAVASGVEWTLASMGTSLTPEQARLLARYAEEAVVGYDGDSAGEAAHRRCLPLLLAEGLGVRRARFPDGHDPDSLRLAAGEEALRDAVEDAPDAVTRELERITGTDVRREPRAQARAARDVVELLKPIRDRILRFGYGRQAAARLGVPLELLAERLGTSRGATEATAPPAREGLVRSLEEQALRLLLADAEAGSTALTVEQLPPAEAFLDPVCRNIYGALRALLSSASASGRAVAAALADDPPAVDRLARILLEGPPAQQRGDLADAMTKLRRRWLRQRLGEVAAAIRGAERSGDRERLELLLKEREDVTLALHRGSAPRASGSTGPGSSGGGA